MRSLVLAFATACGSSKAPPPAPSGPPAPTIAPAARGDVQVATVDGRPVWGSCVTAQVARGATREEGLRQCVDFELLAEAAEHRDFATDPEVVHATRAALPSPKYPGEAGWYFNQGEKTGLTEEFFTIAHMIEASH